jgi:hypothetical protein
MLHTISFKIVAISYPLITPQQEIFYRLETHVISAVARQPIYFVFDPAIHDIKIVYNNFQSRKFFEFPPTALHLPKGCTAKFKDIEDLHHMEATMSLKKAHRLSFAALQKQKNIKASEKLASPFFLRVNA